VADDTVASPDWTCIGAHRTHPHTKAPPKSHGRVDHSSENRPAFLYGLCNHRMIEPIKSLPPSQTFDHTRALCSATVLSFLAGLPTLVMSRHQMAASAVLLLVLCASSAAAQKYNAIFNFGDSITDTGNLCIDGRIPQITFTQPPYGETYFGYPTCRCCDGRVVVDFLSTSNHLRICLA
jgi:hypothetical protein